MDKDISQKLNKIFGLPPQYFLYFNGRGWYAPTPEELKTRFQSYYDCSEDAWKENEKFIRTVLPDFTNHTNFIYLLEVCVKVGWGVPFCGIEKTLNRILKDAPLLKTEVRKRKDWRYI